MKSRAFCLFGLLALSSCMTYEPEPLNLGAFSASDAEFAKATGNATLSGNAFLRQRGGGVVTCAGEEVWIIPATDYSKQVIALWFDDDNYRSYFDARADELDPGFWNSVKKTQCDSDGRFQAREIADGDYFVVTAVRWSVPGRYYSESQGGHMYEPAHIEAGKDVDLVMSQ